MSLYTSAKTPTLVDGIEDIAMRGTAATDPSLLTLSVESHGEWMLYDESEDDESEDDDSDDSYSSSSSDDEDETAMTARMPSTPIKRNWSSPTLVEHELSSVQVNVLLNQVNRRGSMTHASVAPPRSVVYIKGEGMEPSNKIHTKKEDCSDPSTYFNKILTNAGYTPRTFAYNEIDGFFQGITERRVNSYSTDLIAAVKSSNVDHLRSFYGDDKNKNMNSCNRFGESILHTACRHGQMEVVKFLLKEAQVDPRVCDDFGRTPCHDAAWQADPNVTLMAMIATQCPDLLLISDKRGFTPLQYVRKPQWSAWVKMLEANKEVLLPKQLLLLKE